MIKKVAILLIILLPLVSFAQEESKADKLKEYKELLDAGVITQTDYDKLKNEILFGKKSDNLTPKHYCSYTGEEIVKWETIEYNFSEKSDASSIVSEILGAAGIAPNFIVRPMKIDNAAATILPGGQQMIYYNPGFFQRIKNATETNWAVYSVMAHEIGHHVNGHVLKAGGSRPHSELEADYYSGFILYKLGASLEQAKKCMNLIGSSSGSSSHPPKAERLVSITKGWKEAKAKDNRNDDNIEHENKEKEDIRIKEQLEDEKRKEELLKEELASKKTSVTVVYRGDPKNCMLNINIRIGNKTFTPTGSSFTVNNLPIGSTEYEITGSINCGAFGFCKSYGKGYITLKENDTLYVVWQNINYGKCNINLSHH